MPLERGGDGDGNDEKNFKIERDGDVEMATMEIILKVE